MSACLLNHFAAAVLSFKSELAPMKASEANLSWATMAADALRGELAALPEIEAPSQGQLDALEELLGARGREAVRRVAKSWVSGGVEGGGLPRARVSPQGEGGAVFEFERQPDGSLKTARVAQAQGPAEEIESIGRVFTPQGGALRELLGVVEGAFGRVSREALHRVHAREALALMKDPLRGQPEEGLSAAMQRAKEWERSAQSRAQGDPWEAPLAIYWQRLRRCEAERVSLASRFIAEATARALYGEPLKGAMGAKLRLSALTLDDSASPAGLWSPNAVAETLAVMEQTPEAGSLAVALSKETLSGADAERGVELGDAAAGELKKRLKERFYLTEGGWRLLTRHAKERPEFAGLLAHSLRSIQPESKAVERAGEAVALRDGSAPNKREKMALGLCRAASLCAEQGLDMADALEFLKPQWLGDGRGPGVYWQGRGLSLLTEAPRANQSAISGHLHLKYIQEKTDGKASLRGGPTLAESFELMDAWDGALARSGVEGTEFMSPQGFERLASAGWTPQGEGEQKLAAMEQDRLAMFDKGPKLAAGMIRRAAELRGLNSTLDFEKEVDQVRDMLHRVEEGFWQQAPASPSWEWFKAQAQQWHESVLTSKASERAWTPLASEPIACGEGWVAVELTDGGALHKEGQEMRHCVSTYASACAHGSSRIFSLRSTDGKSKSTVEYRCEYPKGERVMGLSGKRGDLRAPKALCLAQHRGFANSEPALGAKLAEGRLAKSLNQLCEAQWSAEKKGEIGLKGQA